MNSVQCHTFGMYEYSCTWKVLIRILVQARKWLKQDGKNAISPSHSRPSVSRPGLTVSENVRDPSAFYLAALPSSWHGFQLRCRYWWSHLYMNLAVSGRENKLDKWRMCFPFKGTTQEWQPSFPLTSPWPEPSLLASRGYQWSSEIVTSCVMRSCCCTPEAYFSIFYAVCSTFTLKKNPKNNDTKTFKNEVVCWSMYTK